MIEIVRRVVGHAEPFHHAPRPDVSRNRERHQRLKPDLLERVPHHLPRALGSQPLPPMIGRESPANLDTRRKRALERRHGQPHKPDKRTIPPELRRTEPETVFPEMSFNPLDEQIALLPGKPSRHKLHDARVRIQPRKRFPVRDRKSTRLNSSHMSISYA